jgi:hypothetical protein
MKKTYLLTISLLVIASCGDDAKPSYSFKNQTLSGKIGNTEWEYGDGYAEVYGLEANSELHVDLFMELDGEGCDLIPAGNEVLFTVPNKVGIYPLKGNLSDLENSMFINMFEEETTMNHLASKGAIEILSITESTVTGRVDAKVDEANTINGNFTVNVCH